MDYITWIILGVNSILLLILLLRPRNNADGLTRQELEQTERRLTDELERGRRATADATAALVKTVESLKNELKLELEKNRTALAESTGEQQARLYRTMAEQMDRLNQTLTQSVSKLQQSNEEKLDQMRQVVDEKLTATLTQRLDSSFKTVGDQLQNVYRSLGEMQQLASGVSDLQRVLTNVKARGTWAEVQLGNLLEQTLTADQYARNVSPRNNGKMVEFAVKIPAREGDGIVWLPIDSKFPQEDYLRLSEAADRADKAAVDEAAKALERTVRAEAKTIHDLYIEVPITTDFAILFLPTEGLYAEVLRCPGLVEDIQQTYRVMICGPTTITAFLNTLRMGFRTIALDKRAAEVWKVLGAAKTQYDNFETVLKKVRRKLEEAGNTLDEADRRNRVIKTKLKTVEALESSEAEQLLALDGVTDEPAEEDV
ncbi:MAG: DNA recombination protein RmuC [Ruminococcaceae bacterium]|nr:DNA recombination protein RmuC [Oscillospiraceae bacterium]